MCEPESHYGSRSAHGQVTVRDNILACLDAALVIAAVSTRGGEHKRARVFLEIIFDPKVKRLPPNYFSEHVSNKINCA